MLDFPPQGSYRKQIVKYNENQRQSPKLQAPLS